MCAAAGSNRHFRATERLAEEAAHAYDTDNGTGND